MVSFGVRNVTFVLLMIAAFLFGVFLGYPAALTIVSLLMLIAVVSWWLFGKADVSMYLFASAAAMAIGRFFALGVF